MRRPVVMMALALSIAPIAESAAALAQDAPPRDWSAEKCRRYREASEEALRRFGREGLGEDFLARHAAFLDRGCVGPADVCPRTSRELALANILVIRAMNAGMASTFPPFACRKD